MTNKEFQDVLKLYPDDYQICLDNVFGWESLPNLEDPHLFVNRDIGQIEIEPEEYRMLDIATIREIIRLYNKHYIKGLDEENIYESIFEEFNEI